MWCEFICEWFLLFISLGNCDWKWQITSQLDQIYIQCRVWYFQIMLYAAVQNYTINCVFINIYLFIYFLTSYYTYIGFLLHNGLYIHFLIPFKRSATKKYCKQITIIPDSMEHNCVLYKTYLLYINLRL